MNFLLVECNLYCRDAQSNYYYYRGAVDQGTHCNKDTGACVDNACVPMSFAPGKEMCSLNYNRRQNHKDKNIAIVVSSRKPTFLLQLEELC